MRAAFEPPFPFLAEHVSSCQQKNATGFGIVEETNQSAGATTCSIFQTQFSTPCPKLLA
ncbi:hypothetical protein CEV33_1041 [Brucella grignonensis]|uniref:Uncharacterized protein n=1 Tax=Brucella grignonensis TaxID=94627 RepID=A0A256FF82_9HYPH|nr:hypothetical protein CEV33_1041 [Brucella grignonensis]